MYAIILAAGKGARAWPATNEIPKSMINIAGKPLLEHQIEWLKSGGVTDIIIDEGYQASVIKKHFGDGRKFEVHIIHRFDPDLSRGAVGHAKDCLKSIPSDEENIIVMAGDVLTNFDLERLIETHEQRGLPVTLYGKELEPQLGIFIADSDQYIIDLKEYPRLESKYINTSIGVVRHDIENYLAVSGHNFWGEILRIFRGSLYTEDGSGWWHLTDISDAYRMDRQWTDLRNAQNLVQQAEQYEEMANYARRQAAQLQEKSMEGRGKEAIT